MMRSRKSNLPALIARAIIFVAAFSFSVCFSFKQNRAEEKCATFFAESRVLSSSLFLKKKLVFFLSYAEIFVFGFLLLPLLLLSSLPLSKRPKEKKISPEEARAFRSHEAVSSHHHARQKALALLQTLLAFGGSVLPFVIVCARVLVVICEREREREKSGDEEESSEENFFKKFALFPLQSSKVPPSKGKRKKKRRDSK